MYDLAHVEHCCFEHGCKYGDDHCPVVKGQLAKYKCEECLDDKALESQYRNDPEIVICSAIRLPNGKIFRGHRHVDCARTAKEYVIWNGGFEPGEHHWHPSLSGNQGFITSRNRYVGREEGLQLQIAAGIQSIRGGYHSTMLFSEDLY